MLSVKYVTKVVAMDDPEYRLLNDREETFSSFSRAMEFVRNLKGSIPRREVLLGNPQIEEEVA